MRSCFLLVFGFFIFCRDVWCTEDMKYNSSSFSEMHLFVVVIYRKMVLESDTIVSLIKCAGTMNVGVVIWDNSPSEFQEKNKLALEPLYEEFLLVDYRPASENTSLSLLYNQVMESYFSDRSASRITFLDQDSVLAQDFILRIGKEGPSSGILIVPKVVSNRTGAVASPRYQNSYYLFTKYRFRQDFQISDCGYFTSQNLFAVGSGLTVPFELWSEGLRFDENISFYGVDTEFCRDYQSLRNEFMLADTVLIHDISSENIESAKLYLWRFDRYMEYWEYQLGKHSPYPKFLTRAYVKIFQSLYKLKQRLRSL